MVTRTGYSALFVFSAVPNGDKKTALLETRADRKGYRAFAAASTNPRALTLYCKKKFRNAQKGVAESW